MKQLKNLSIFMLVALMAATFASCSKDDDNADFDLSRYIVGTWHSYKAVGYIQGGEYYGQSYELAIDKTGQYADSYVECKFQEGNKVTVNAFKKDDNGILHWEEEQDSYVVKGNVVTITDADGTGQDLMFDQKDNTLCLQASGVSNEGIPVKISVYLKK